MMKLIEENGLNGGVQKVYRSDNNLFGASVVRNAYSYGGKSGKWELAVIEFEDHENNYRWNLTYDTPITDDVLGHLTQVEVEMILDQIDALPQETTYDK